jgi:slime mold repeat-containing protein
MFKSLDRCQARPGVAFTRVLRVAAVAALLVGTLAGCSQQVADDEGETLGVSSEALTMAQIWGFEDPSGWTITTGSANKQSSTIHDEGSLSLQLTASAFVAVRGASVAKPAAISPLLAVDVMIPTQAGPYYLGAVQMTLSVPSLNINSQWINQKELSVPTGVWQRLTFQIPANIYSQLTASSFSDLQISLGLNPPAGLNQPFRFDNLRFLPAPSCVGQTNGTLCDDSVACTTGTSCNAGVCGSVTTVPPGSACDAGDDVLGFENFPAWQPTTGAAALAPSSTHVQGVRSLQINTPYFMTVASVPLSTLHKVSQTLSLRVQKPTHQPNPSWHGDITLNMVSPSLGINFAMNKPLTGQPSGSFFELQFAVPAATYQALATHTYSDLTFSISINPPNGQNGAYLLDDLHFVPVASCSGAIDKTACEDNTVCTQGDVCQAGVCGATISCDDANVCTDDACNAVTGCFHAANTASCNDGNACTAGDICSGSVCVPGAAVVCNDSNGCTDDSCNPATGCVFSNNTAPCSDSNACTTGDVCSGGACIPGGPTSCDDANGCTNDVCVAPTGCTHPSACGGGVCVGNACCQPLTCLALKAECGTFPDGCGGTVDCSSLCPAGGSCNPANKCLPPNNYNEPSGINVCETLLEALIIPPTFDDVFTCDDDQCGIFHPDCCVPGLCLLNPFCTILSKIEITPEEIYNAGDVYCSVTLTPKQYLERLINGRLTDLSQVGTFLASGGTTALYDFDVQVMSQAGKHIPDNARAIIRDLVAPIYNGGATGFSHDDLDNVKVVSSDFPTAGFYLPGDRLAITLGPVIVLKAKYYDALFKDSNGGVAYSDFLTSPSVCNRYIAAVDIMVHELVHVKQYRELGRYNFTVQYLGSALANGYGEVGFEHEAFNYQIGVSELQGGRFCSVMAQEDNATINSYGLSVPLNTCTPQVGRIDSFPACP